MARTAPQAFILKNAINGAVWCTDGEWHVSRFVAMPGVNMTVRGPRAKSWTTQAGADRWLNARPAMRDYAKAVEAV